MKLGTNMIYKLVYVNNLKPIYVYNKRGTFSHYIKKLTKNITITLLGILEHFTLFFSSSKAICIYICILYIFVMWCLRPIFYTISFALVLKKLCNYSTMSTSANNSNYFCLYLFLFTIFASFSLLRIIIIN